MANSYFRFKQFTVEQDRCAMKVSTDACIQGAWTPVGPAVRRILDVGTGTGLLSLMLAQRCNAYIDAVEIDAAAAAQAADNVNSSPWADRINLVQEDILAYCPANKYDMVIINPPFFVNSLQGPDSRRNTARHLNYLTISSLCNAIYSCMHELSYLSILLPVNESGVWISALEQTGLKCFKKLFIHPREGKEPNRVIMLLDQRHTHLQNDEGFYIKNLDGTYTTEMKNLLSAFYLH